MLINSFPEQKFILSETTTLSKMAKCTNKSFRLVQIYRKIPLHTLSVLTSVQSAAIC